MLDGHFHLIKAVQNQATVQNVNTQPIHSASYSAGLDISKFKNLKINEMLATGAIEHSERDRLSLIAFILKEDETLRFCIGHPRLSEVMIRNSYQTASMDDCIVSLDDAMLLSALDVNKQY